MARDYKNSGRNNAPKGKSGGMSGLIGLLTGLVIGGGVGLVLGLGVVGARFYQELQEHQALFAPEPKSASKPTAARQDDALKFEFYQKLQEMEVKVPVGEDKPAAKPTKPAVAAKERYLLQVASFQKHADAEEMKARLALEMAIQAEIQAVEVKPGDTRYRVRVGPLEDQNELSRIRQRLQSNGIEAVLVKLSG